MLANQQSGFTLVELMVGSLITLVTVSALMIGIANVRYTLQSINLREKAFEKLTAYTNHWKAYIYKAEFSDYDIWLRNTWSDADIDTLIYGIPNQFGSETPRVIAELKRKAYRDSEEGYESYPYGYYTLETKIRWQDLKGNWIGENYLTFTSSQLVKDELE
tara:strand:- start:1170 stop:1652 length:483 start_codon:yes stop_codon:yes gene_type:complete